eukprot:tig00021348_g20585.t1
MAARGIRRVVFSTGSGLQWASAKVADLLQDPSVQPSLSTVACRDERNSRRQTRARLANGPRPSKQKG